MTRYGCFEIQATCKHCGQPLPVNGPMRVVTCATCSQATQLPADHIPEFLNDLEKEYDHLEEKQGRGGQLMGGGQSYHYGYYRLAPRCEKCKTPLSEVQPGTDGHVFCIECGRRYHTYPAPDWLRARVPSVVQIISPEREMSAAAGSQQLELDQEKPQPIMMTCPGCGGGLTITADTHRTCLCQFCQGQVFIPDELWSRLHPVKTKQEWFVRFEGQSQKRLNDERRRRDQQEERAEIARLPRAARKGDRNKSKPNIFTILAIVLGVLVAGAGTIVVVGLQLLGFALEEELAAVPFALGFTIALAGVLLPALVPAMLGTRAGPWKASKQAMIAIARRHGMEIHGEHQHSYIGSARGRIQGRDVSISPSSDDAIEVDLDERAFYLKTDPRYPHPDEGLWRFTTRDPRFDNLFPIRYATPAIVQRIEQGNLTDLAPLFWFIERWGSRLARMDVDTDVELHLLPGGAERENHTKYLAAEDMEPLLNDTLVLAKALEAVALGKQPQLPGPTGQVGSAPHPQAPGQYSLPQYGTPPG